MADLADKAAPGKVVVGLTEVRFDRWLPAAPSTDVTVAVQPVGPEHGLGVFGEYARAVVRLGGLLPGRRPLPVASRGVAGVPARISATGPVPRAVAVPRTPVPGCGHDHRARGHPRAGRPDGRHRAGGPPRRRGPAPRLLRPRHAPRPVRPLPRAIDRIDFSAPSPPPGTPVTCLVWVPWTERDWLQAHLQLIVDGRVWAEVNGWVDRRFDVRPDIDEAFRFPERHTVGPSYARRVDDGRRTVVRPRDEGPLRRPVPRGRGAARVRGSAAPRPPSLAPGADRGQGRRPRPAVGRRPRGRSSPPRRGSSPTATAGRGHRRTRAGPSSDTRPRGLPR